MTCEELLSRISRGFTGIQRTQKAADGIGQETRLLEFCLDIAHSNQHLELLGRTPSSIRSVYDRKE